MHSFELKITKSIFGQGSAPDPIGGAYDAPPDPLVSCGGGHPSPYTSPRRLRCPDLGASNGVPFFYGRFTVTLPEHPTSQTLLRLSNLLTIIGFRPNFLFSLDNQYKVIQRSPSTSIKNILSETYKYMHIRQGLKHAAHGP